MTEMTEMTEVTDAWEPPAGLGQDAQSEALAAGHAVAALAVAAASRFDASG